MRAVTRQNEMMKQALQGAMLLCLLGGTAVDASASDMCPSCQYQNPRCFFKVLKENCCTWCRDSNGKSHHRRCVGFKKKTQQRPRYNTPSFVPPVAAPAPKPVSAWEARPSHSKPIPSHLTYGTCKEPTCAGGRRKLRACIWSNGFRCCIMCHYKHSGEDQQQHMWDINQNGIQEHYEYAKSNGWKSQHTKECDALQVQYKRSMQGLTMSSAFSIPTDQANAENFNGITEPSDADDNAAKPGWADLNDYTCDRPECKVQYKVHGGYCSYDCYALHNGLSVEKDDE